jgi:hypothetical protein
MHLILDNYGTLVRPTDAKADSPGNASQPRALERAIQEFLDLHNQQPRPFVWTKTADEILESFAPFL